MKYFRQNLLWLGMLVAAASFLVVDQRFTASDEMKSAYGISREIADATVLVKRESGGGGTGVVIYQDDTEAHVLTCNHVVAGAKTLTLIWRNGMFDEEITTDAQLMSFDVSRDVALLKTKPVWRGVARVITERQFVHEFSIYVKCVVLGYPGTLGIKQPFVHAPHMTEGYISDLHENRYMRASAPITYGSSGSGVFVMMDGHWTLVGMVQAVKTVDDERSHPLVHVSFCLHPLHLLDFLQN